MSFEPNRPSTQTPESSASWTIDPLCLLAAIVDSSDDPIISERTDGTIVGWNPAAARVFGYQPEEIAGKSVLTLIPPEGRRGGEEILDRVKNGEQIKHCEMISVRKNGEKFASSVTISPITDEEGNVVASAGIVRDISERKKTDESRFRLDAIVNSADDAIISKDLRGVIQSWNEGAHKIFGYTDHEMIGQSILRLIPEELHYEEDEILRRLQAGERISHYETIRRKKSGETTEVSVTISPIRDGSGRVIGASKIARDISDRKRVERLLLQSEKLAATGRMAAAIAHEINNPLESLINLIFLARQNSIPDGKVYNLLTTAEEELERVAHIARQTLGYYKDTGSLTMVYLHDLLGNVLTVYNAKIISSSISVDSHFDDLEKIYVSKGEMLQVFSNIIANAIDAMKHGGVLGVSLRKTLGSAGEGIQVVIRDNGVGIEQEHLTKVFDPFFTTKGDLGTGIGLWVAKQLVERRGGKIDIASSTTPRQSGTAVTIFLPFARPQSSLKPGGSQAV